MQKLARTDAPKSSQPEYVPLSFDTVSSSLTANCRARKNIPQNLSSRSVLLLNMFDPDECVTLSTGAMRCADACVRETERDWDKDLAEDVKGECETKYGKVTALKVEKDSQVRLVCSRVIETLLI